ncbi:MAG: hypothetical protein KC777_14995 [Cyanobacteria bacterium HKST-UBA02]|nr:hypothetical protein [Cyanobacteria bacterium HKST-UBA02]
MTANKVNALFAEDLEVLLDGSSVELRKGGRVALKGVCFGLRLNRDELSGRCMFYGGDDIKKLAKDGDKVVCSDGTELTGAICGIGEHYLLIQDDRKRTVAMDLERVSDIKTDRIFDFGIPLAPVAGLGITGDSPFICKAGDAFFFQEPVKPATLEEIATLLDAAQLDLKDDEKPLLCIPAGFAANSDAVILPVRIVAARRTETEEFPYTPGAWAILPDKEDEKEAEWKAPVQGTGGKSEEILIAQLRKIASIRIPIPQEVLLGLELEKKQVLFPKNPAPGVKIKIRPVRRVKRKLKISRKPGKKKGNSQPGSPGNIAIAKTPPGGQGIPMPAPWVFDAISLNKKLFIETVNDNFRTLDTDGDGYLTRDELLQAINNPAITGKLAVCVSAMYCTVTDLEEASNDEYGDENSGITRNDIKVMEDLNTKTKWVSKVLSRVTGFSTSINFARTRELFPGGTSAITPAGVSQGYMNDCFFMAALGGVAARCPALIEEMIEVHGENVGSRQFVVTFPGCGPVVIDEPTDAELSMYARGTKSGIWAAVLEKAYAVHVNGDNSSQTPQESLMGGSSDGAGIRAFTGGGFRNIRILAIDTDTLDDVHIAINQGLKENRLVVMGIGGSCPKALAAGINDHHLYAVVGYNPGTRTVSLFNPLGDEPDGAGADGLYVRCGDPKDGIFEIPLEYAMTIFTNVQVSNNTLPEATKIVSSMQEQLKVASSSPTPPPEGYTACDFNPDKVWKPEKEEEKQSPATETSGNPGVYVCYYDPERVWKSEEEEKATSDPPGPANQEEPKFYVCFYDPVRVWGNGEEKKDVEFSNQSVDESVPPDGFICYYDPRKFSDEAPEEEGATQDSDESSQQSDRAPTPTFEYVHVTKTSSEGAGAPESGPAESSDKQMYVCFYDPEKIWGPDTSCDTGSDTDSDAGGETGGDTGSGEKAANSPPPFGYIVYAEPISNAFGGKEAFMPRVPGSEQDKNPEDKNAVDGMGKSYSPVECLLNKPTEESSSPFGGPEAMMPRIPTSGFIRVTEWPEDDESAPGQPDSKVEKQPMDVRDALKTGQCTFEAWGPDGVDTLHMFVKLTNVTASPLQVVKPAYMCFLSSSSTCQNMINTEDPPLLIAPGKSLQLEIPTVCASTKTVKPPPAKGSKVQYRIGDYPDPELFKKLIRILKTSKTMSQSKVYTTLPINPKIRDRKVAQLAIWKVLGDMSDNPEDKVTRKSLEKDLLEEMNRAKLSHKQQHAIDSFSAELYHAILETIKRSE